MHYYVTFVRSVKETVRVDAESAEEAADVVYDSFGQDVETCKSIDIMERDFEVTEVLEVNL